MKLVVFAHIPPPFHGQSYMVRLMLDGVLARQTDSNFERLQIFHVNARLSSNLAAIGKSQWSKLFLVLKYCAQAYFYRFVHKATCFYYVPAPGLRSALYRDWIVMLFCRPIFQKIIFHWHAVGLGEWLETIAKPWEKKVSLWLLGNVDLSIVLSEFGRPDATRLSPRRIEVVPNGIPDPCEDFDRSILPMRETRFRNRTTDQQTIFTVVFMGACTESKGLFAALDAITLINRQLAEARQSIGVRLIVAGDFLSEKEHQRFQRRIAQPDLNGAMGTNDRAIVVYKGFVQGADKNALFREADCLCFPSLYPAEGQPVIIVEALAFGLAVAATRWRGVPELLDGADAQIVNDQNPAAIAAALELVLNFDGWITNRRVFLDRYNVDKFIENLTGAILSVN